MATRDYDFTTGIETPTAPTATDPSSDADLVNLGYAKANFARGILNITALKAIAASGRTDNLPIFVFSKTSWYYFDADASDSGDDDLIVEPDAGTGRWFKLESSGGGGGGSSVLWDEYANAPLKELENNFSVYKFGYGLSQELYTEIDVPTSYVAGSQIKLHIKIYSPDSSGDILLSAQSTLIKAETDPVSSTTNQRTTTNSAISLGAGTVNEPQKVELDLTDASGEINSVAVSPGDSILVRLYRNTDTATDDVRFLHKQSTPTFA